VDTNVEFTALRKLLVRLIGFEIRFPNQFPAFVVAIAARAFDIGGEYDQKPLAATFPTPLVKIIADAFAVLIADAISLAFGSDNSYAYTRILAESQ
jgi:hypothetical protein